LRIAHGIEVKAHIAEMLRNWEFTEWECMFAAVEGGEIVGMASIMKTDYYPLPEIFPWISCIFVTESSRGRRISGELINSANAFAKELASQRPIYPRSIRDFMRNTDTPISVI